MVKSWMMYPYWGIVINPLMEIYMRIMDSHGMGWRTINNIPSNLTMAHIPHCWLVISHPIKNPLSMDKAPNLCYVSSGWKKRPLRYCCCEVSGTQARSQARPRFGGGIHPTLWWISHCPFVEFVSHTWPYSSYTSSFCWIPTAHHICWNQRCRVFRAARLPWEARAQGTQTQGWGAAISRPPPAVGSEFQSHQNSWLLQPMIWIISHDSWLY